MSPESAVVPPWRGIFVSHNISLVAIDEAHCIPEWYGFSMHYAKYAMNYRGSDLRQAFSRIGGLRALTSVPFMALTASAPPTIQAEICSSLHFYHPVVVTRPLDRANIYLSVSKSSGVKVKHIHV